MAGGFKSKPKVLFSSVGVPARGIESVICGRWECLSWLSVTEQLWGWGAILINSDGKTISLTNHQWENEHALMSLSHISTHHFHPLSYPHRQTWRFPRVQEWKSLPVGYLLAQSKQGDGTFYHSYGWKLSWVQEGWWEEERRKEVTTVQWFLQTQHFLYLITNFTYFSAGFFLKVSV